MDQSFSVDILKGLKSLKVWLSDNLIQFLPQEQDAQLSG